MGTTQTAAVMDEIRAEAARRHVSVKELARRVEIDYGTMRNYLAGRRDMPMDVLYRVTDALGMAGAAGLFAAAERHTSGRDALRALGASDEDIARLTEGIHPIAGGDHGTASGNVAQ